MKEITVSLRNVFGVERIYPVDADAKTFAAMLSQETLTAADIAFIKALGYRVLVRPVVSEL